MSDISTTTAGSDDTDAEHPEHSAHHHSSKLTKRERTIAVVVVSLAFVMDLADNTIVNVAIPTIQENMHMSYAGIQWLIAGYALSFAVLLITAGRLGDVVGYRKMFLIGVSVFTLSSLMCGIAPGPGTLIAGRILQGAGGALMVPQVMSLVQVMFKPNERGQIMGIFGALGGLAASLGPIIGGFLIHFNIAGLDWRPIFLVNIPIGIFAIIAGLRVVPEGRSPHPLKLDIWGTVLIMAALAMIIYPLIQGRELGWPAWGFAMLIASLPILAVFIWWQRRKFALDGSPLVVPSLFRHRSFNAGLTLNVVFNLVMIGAGLATTLTFQIGFGWSVLRQAVTGLPIAIGIGAAIGGLAPMLTKKLGRNVLFVGGTLMIVGYLANLLIVSKYEGATHPWQIVPALFVVGIGMGLMMGTFFTVTLQDVDSTHAGSASGTISAFDQVAAAVGIALVGVLFFGALGHHANKSFDVSEPEIRQQLTAAHIPDGPTTEAVNAMRTCYVDRTSESNNTVIPESCKRLEQANAANANANGSQQAQSIAKSMQKAVANNFTNAYVITTIFQIIMVGLCMLLTLLLPRRFHAVEGAH